MCYFSFIENNDEKFELYRRFATKYPRSDLPRKLPLEFLEGNEFKESVDKYMQRALHKGVPPLFKELKCFYSNKDKINIIENLLLSYIENLKNNHSLKGLLIN